MSGHKECEGVPRKIIRVGSRKSQLALIQTQLVIDSLKAHHLDLEFTVVTKDTLGDNILDKPLSKIGDKALFTRELEDELLLGNVDIIIHSLKDIPTTLPDKCCIGAISKREDPTDSIVIRSDLAHTLPQNCSFDSIVKNDQIKTFGTSSLRRIAQLEALSTGCCVKDVRGNLNTRLEKLDNHKEFGFDCLILATSGLKRAGFEKRINHKLQWYHAVSQGALGIECRVDDRFMVGHVLRPIVDLKTLYECTAERVFLKYLEGGCSVPIGVQTQWTNDHILVLKGIVLSLDGKERMQAEIVQNLDEPNEDKLELEDSTGVVLAGEDATLNTRFRNSIRLGRRVGAQLVQSGVKCILDQIEKKHFTNK